jgi:SPP1 gp7 family putative phage head morphogenesis protein
MSPAEQREFRRILAANVATSDEIEHLRAILEKRTTLSLKQALGELLQAYGSNISGEFIDPSAEAARIHELFIRDQQLKDAVSRAVQDAADLGVTVGVDTLEGMGFGFDYTLANVHAREWALQRSGELITELAQTTREGVRQAVSRYIGNAEPKEKLISDLEVYFSRKRADMIATTEVTRSFAEGNRIAYRESGVVDGLIWLTSNDEKTCNICAPLNGRIVSLEGGDFRGHLPDAVRDKQKQVISAPPAHPRCRCSVAGYVPKPELT